MFCPLVEGRHKASYGKLGAFDGEGVGHVEFKKRPCQPVIFQNCPYSKHSQYDHYFQQGHICGFRRVDFQDHTDTD